MAATTCARGAACGTPTRWRNCPPTVTPSARCSQRRGPAQPRRRRPRNRAPRAVRPSGAVWSLPRGGDLDANAVVLAAGDAVGAHVNEEVDVVIVGVAGRGVVDVDGEESRLAAGCLVHVPKGTSRTIVADGDEPLVYVTVHRARAGLGIRGH